MSYATYTARATEPSCDGPRVCGDFDEARVYRLGYLAYRLGLTINSGFLARYPLRLVEVCNESEKAREQKLDSRTIYVPASADVMPQDAAVCGQLDGYTACVAKDRSTRFSRALAGS